MIRTFCKGKIHRAVVTQARLDYPGSITICRDLMRAADILPYEMVHINSIANAVHWETYAIPGAKGTICLNGCPARLFQPGDKVIILSLGQYAEHELEGLYAKVVRVDEANEIVNVENHEIARELK
jgi:aspartate 1-decarboxylase